MDHTTDVFSYNETLICYELIGSFDDTRGSIVHDLDTWKVRVK